MSKKNIDSKKNALRFFSGRSGIILVALLAVMILVVSLVTMSYSWFTPEVKKGTGMTYQADLKIRSENCSIEKTLKATVTNGVKNYSNTVGATEKVSAKSISYFRTIIINEDPNATNVSLYATTLPSGTYGLGVAYPSNSYHKYTGGSDVYIVRNAYIEGKADGENGEIYVDWFIRNDSSSEITVNFSTLNLYLMYN